MKWLTYNTNFTSRALGTERGPPGEGAAPVPASVCCFYARPDVVFVPLEDAPPTEVALVWRTAGETAKNRAFADVAREVVGANGGPADA